MAVFQVVVEVRFGDWVVWIDLGDMSFDVGWSE